ncbi:MAG: hypothetical protein ACLR2O_17195 [Coprococcus sp.]
MDLGNSLIVVEHDEDTMLRGRLQLVDIGPGAGEHGGEVVAAGNGRRTDGKVEKSITGAYLSGRSEDSGAGSSCRTDRLAESSWCSSRTT